MEAGVDIGSLSGRDEWQTCRRCGLTISSVSDVLAVVAPPFALRSRSAWTPVTMIITFSVQTALRLIRRLRRMLI